VLRPLSGFKASFQHLTMVVVSEFDEWRVVVYSPEVFLQGHRQFTDVKAKEHALALVKQYFQEINQETPSGLPEPDWRPTNPAEWLVWRV
jgi:hypothetical protein